MPTRRAFLQSGLCLSGPLLSGGLAGGLAAGGLAATGLATAGLATGCLADEQALPEGASRPRQGREGDACDGLAQRGTFLGVEPFVGESTQDFERVFDEGLDGRLYTDLSKLDETRLITPSDAFYVRTRYPDQLDPSAPWSVRLRGAITRELDVPLAEMLSAERPLGVHLMECSGNARAAGFGLMSSAEWSGVPVSELLARAEARAAGTRVLISGFDGHSMPSRGNHSTPGASWVFRREDLETAGAFLATAMNAQALSRDHGAPLRLLVPGWYGCCCIKWVDEIRFVGEDEPATSQMMEFASRTHQLGTPALAREYQPARAELAAMPIRVERWAMDGQLVLRVVGIVWGGQAPVSELEIRIGDGAWTPLRLCTETATPSSWTLWTHLWTAPARGAHDIVLRVPDRSIPTRRLDQGYYLRRVSVTA